MNNQNLMMPIVIHKPQNRLMFFMLLVLLLLSACTTDPIEEPSHHNDNPNVVDPYHFTHTPPGSLLPKGSGNGLSSTYVFAPNIRFPIERSPAYINSQVYGIGGMNGSAGSLCDAKNFRYPWHDNYCEKRSWKMPLCPTGKGHQGVDIRPATCSKTKWWAVAVEDGTITSIGSYTVYLRGKHSGTTYRYMHLNKKSLKVKKGRSIRKGQRIGIISNNMGKAKTSIHLHFDMKQTIRLPNGKTKKVYVPPYTSLVNAYLRLLKEEAKP